MKKKQRIFSGIYTKNPDTATNAFIVDTKQQEMDSMIAPFYLWETLAHNLMLAKGRLVPEHTAKKILGALLDLLGKLNEQTFIIQPEIGDVHENIESWLTQKIGNEAGWFHLARSRNDQITCDQKLITKHLFFEFGHKLKDLSALLSDKSTEYAETIMPGFTHLRTAMPSSFGFWWQSYCIQIMDIQQLLKKTYEVTDVCPLGAGASYGVNWKIDPKVTSSHLGFELPLQNSLAAINNRGMHEYYWLSLLTGLATILSRMMEDLIIWSMPELNYIAIAEDYTTGSSIMPQKMNPDIAEKIRAKVGVFSGNLVNIITTLKGTPSGYNRDSADTKLAIISSFTEMIQILDITAAMVSTVIPNKEKMLLATQEALATKVADQLAGDFGVPFRLAHRIVGESLKKAQYNLDHLTRDILLDSCSTIIGEKPDITNEWIQQVTEVKNALSLYSYPGSPNPTYVQKGNMQLKKQNEAFMKWVTHEETNFSQAREKLLREVTQFVKP